MIKLNYKILKIKSLYIQQNNSFEKYFIFIPKICLFIYNLYFFN